MVEIEGAGQSGTGLDGPGGAVVVGGNGILGQKLATDALMVAFGVVMGDVFADKMSQVGLAKDDEVIEAFMPDGLDEAFSMRITVRALRRDGGAVDAAAGQEEFPLLREQRVAIVHQEPSAAQKTIDWIAKIANDLEHPCFVRINTNAGDVNDARLALYDEEDHVPDGAEGTKGFNAEEVAGVKGGPMPFKKIRPRLLLKSFRRWFQASFRLFLSMPADGLARQSEHAG